MKRFTSNDEIEDLCEAMIKDFFKSKHYTNVMCVDIEAFVRNIWGFQSSMKHLQSRIPEGSDFCQMASGR